MNTAFLILFILLQIVDIWLQIVNIWMTDKRKANPLINWFFQRFDHIGMMVAFKIAATWLLWYADVYFITAVACALYVWVVINNWKVIQAQVEPLFPKVEEKE